MTQNDNSYNPRVKRHLDLLRDTPPRDPEAANLGKQNFLNLAASLPKPVSLKRSWRLNDWIIEIKRKKERHTMFTITTLVVVLTMLFGGAGATVYAAQDSMPNDALYAVKTWTEDIQLDMTKDPEAKFDLIESYVYRRIAELDSLLAKGETIPEDFITRLESQLKFMGEAVTQVDPESNHIRQWDRDMTNSPCETNDGSVLPFLACERIQEMWNNQVRWSQTITDTITGTITSTIPSENPLRFGPGNDGDDTTEPPFQDESPGPDPLCDPDFEECAPFGPQYEAPAEPPSEPPMYSGDNEDNLKPEEPKQESNPDNGNPDKP